LVAPKAEFNLKLNDSYVALGGNLEGTLTVTPHEDIEATEIRCEINCVETVEVMKTDYDPNLRRTVTK